MPKVDLDRTLGCLMYRKISIYKIEVKILNFKEILTRYYCEISWFTYIYICVAIYVWEYFVPDIELFNLDISDFTAKMKQKNNDVMCLFT